MLCFPTALAPGNYHHNRLTLFFICEFVQARRKAEKEEKKRRKAEKEAKRAAKMAAMEAGEDKKEGGDDGEDDDLMYGAPDDHAWTDKSHAHKEAEEKAKEGPDMSVSWLCLVNAFICADMHPFLFLIHRIFITPPFTPTAHLRQGWQEAQQ